jgi:hypothetical protein
MKCILSLLALFPFIVFAQTKKAVSKTPPLIESISSDTVNGLFYQVSFLYDNNRRVIRITNKQIKIQTKPIQTVAERKIKEQLFEYQGTAKMPFSRKTNYYQHTTDDNNRPIILLKSVEQQYFLYENNQRIGDSTLCYVNISNELNWNWEKEASQKRIGKLEQSTVNIHYKIDLTKPYSPPNIYTDQLTLTPENNIASDHSSYRYANRSNDASYYNYASFDTMINPLKQLNIADALANEKIPSQNGGQYGKTDVSWYYINQNNYTEYSVTTDEQTQHYKYTFKFNYTYNQFKQPLHAKAQVNQSFNKGGQFVRDYQQRFTFKYKK